MYVSVFFGALLGRNWEDAVVVGEAQLIENARGCGLADLARDMGAMHFYRALRKEELFGNLIVFEALADKFEDLSLAVREHFDELLKLQLPIFAARELKRLLNGRRKLIRVDGFFEEAGRASFNERNRRTNRGVR